MKRGLSPVSYNDDTASDFSKYTRDGIRRIKINPEDIIFSDIFFKNKDLKGIQPHSKNGH